ncbi:MAG: GAF domain-containing sensor histidine kinase [Chloroflexota bacterium]|nr:GAF domain-containing sensor histidine kinase [Chloroflexota bacterium]
MNTLTIDLVSPDVPQRLLSTLEKLLAIDAVEVKQAMDQASDLLAAAVGADKTDVFLYDPLTDALVAAGTSHSPMGREQIALGLDHLPIAKGGRTVEVYQTGQPFFSGQVQHDPKESFGVRQGLGIQSVIVVAMTVNGHRRGVLEMDSAQPDAFSQDDLYFAQAVAHWIGAVAHRAELVEQMRQDAVIAARHVTAEELVTVLAHDLGNYLTPLFGRISLIRSRAVREERTQDMRDAVALEKALVRLNDLIQDLLDVGRLEQGIFALTVQPLDVVALVQETAAVLHTAGCPVEVAAPAALNMEADPNRLRQALENLIGNAIKHSPQGAPVVITVTAQPRDAGLWVIITVRDQGLGISPDLLPHLFTRFAAGSGSSGLGLGLYLAHSIAVAHGGTLTVQSLPGQGAQFQLTLPLHPRKVSTGRA